MAQRVSDCAFEHAEAITPKPPVLKLVPQPLSIQDVAKAIFGDAADGAVIFEGAPDDGAVTIPEVSVGGDHSGMTNAQLDLVIGDLAYGVADNKLALAHANLIGRKAGRQPIGVYVFPRPVHVDKLPEDAVTSLPLGAGWAFEPNTTARVEAQFTLKLISKIAKTRSPYATPRAKEQFEDSVAGLPDGYYEQAEAAYDGREVHTHNILTLATALACADHGLPVIDSHTFYTDGSPTRPDGDAKSPRGAGWPQEATTDTQRIVDRWLGHGEYPATKTGDARDYATFDKLRNTSIVIRYGLPASERFAILDIDGPEGEANLAKLEAEHGTLPPTVTVVSGSGGRQLYFRVPNRVIKNSSNEIAPKIDVRGEGGQGLAPSSMHKSGFRYVWALGLAPWEVEIAVAPVWLEDAMFYATKANQTKSKGKAKSKPHKKSKDKSQTKSSGFDSGAGLEAHLAQIGDGEGLKGFNDPIYAAFCSYFGTEGASAPFEPIIETLRETINNAERDPSRDRAKYDDDGYLIEQAQKARDFIAEKGDLEPVNLTEAEIKELIAAAGIDRDSSIADVSSFLSPYVGHDNTVRPRFNAVLKEDRGNGVTVLSAQDLNGIWKKLDAELRKEDEDEGEVYCVVNQQSHSVQVRYALDCLGEAHSQFPSLFRYGTEVARPIYVPEEETLSLEIVSKDGMRAEINKCTDFQTMNAGGELRGVATPLDVNSDIYQEPQLPLPYLRGVSTYPQFDKDVNLLASNGYHASAHLFMHLPEDLKLPKVSDTPTEDELAEAKRLIVVEFVGDVPFDGYTRREFEVACGVAEPLAPEVIKPVPPSFLSYLAFLLQTLTRPVIGKHPMPAFLATKPESGSGASLIVDLAQLICVGATSTRPSIPKDEEERRKAFFAALRGSVPFIVLDNVVGAVDSPVLAALLTSVRFTDRVLGRSEERSIPNNASVAITGNNPLFTKELRRRMSLCRIDAGVEHPSEREGFRHEELVTWVTDNRGRLLWALCTLVTNWKASGCKPPSGKTRRSYEEWFGVCGGIIEAAGWEGFQSNRDQLEELAGAAEDDPLRDFVIQWFEVATTSATSMKLKAQYSAGPDGLATFCNDREIPVPVRRRKDAEGDVVYDATSFGQFLAANKNRVVSVDEDTNVKLVSGKKTKIGTPWSLEVVQSK